MRLPLLTRGWAVALGAFLGLAQAGLAQSNDPPCGNPPSPPPPSNCTHSSSSNPFNPYSGSVGREVVDWEPAHSLGVSLRFARYHASRWDVNPGFDLPYEKPFGDGGNWRHRFQWTVLDNGTNEAGLPSIRIVYNNGFYANFAKTDSNAVHMTYLASTHERILPDGTNYYLIMLDGTRYHFTGWTNEGGRFYRMEGFIDPYSNRYDFVYADGRLVRVVAPNTNLFVEFSYTTFTNSQPPGDIEFRFDDNQATQVLLAGSFNGWQGQEMTNSEGTWLRTVPLTEGIYEYKFVARYAGQSNDVWHTDPENPLYTLPFSNSVALIQSNAWTATVLESVRGSDGRTVSYGYGRVWGTGIVHVVLTNVLYEDGSQASYTYYHPSEDWDRRPLLKTADDPHYSGPARAVLYLYQSNNVYPGQIYEERSLVTSQLLARLELDGARPQWRRVTWADGSQEVYLYGTNTGQVLEFTNAVGDVYRRGYFMVGDAEGMLAWEADPLGRTTTYTRTWHFGAVTIASNSARGVRRYIYTNEDEPFYLATEVDESGRTNAYTRDERHRVTRRDNPDGTYETNAYNEFGQLVAQRRRDGSEWRWAYDERGRKVAETDPLGQVTHYGYDAYDRLAWVSNALGHVTRYYYNWRGQITNVVYPDGSEEKTWYDRYGQATQRQDRAGGMWVTDYDELGHVRTTRDPLGYQTYYRYDALGRLVLTSNAVGLVVSNTYDAIGRKIRETFSTDGTYTEWHYDPDGVRTQINRLGGVRVFEYDREGRLAAERDEAGRWTRYGYDAAGNRTHVTNALGDVTIYTYDAAGRITSIRDCEGAVVSNAYDGGGRLVMQIAPNGIVTSNAYDAAGWLLASWRGGLLLFSNTYNALGWLVAQQDANGIVTTNEYDAAGRVVRSYRPDGTYSENVYSNTYLVEVVDPAGRRTRYQRDVLGRVTNQIDNATNSVRYGYDALGNLTELYDQNGNLTRFVYDAEGRQTAKIYADNSQYTYGYDALGRLISKLDAKGVSTVYRYDPVGNLTNVDYATDADVYFEYDALNRMTTMVDGIGTTRYAYAGSCGKVEGGDGPFENDTIGYGYDASKRLVAVTSASAVVQYSYDALDRITQVVWQVGAGAPRTNTYSYVGHSRVPTLLRHGNGVETHYAYDPLVRLTNLVHRYNGTNLASFGYTYNAADLRTRVVRGGAGLMPTAIDYSYDPIGQLIGAEGDFPGYRFEYAYDAAGNPVRQDQNGFVVQNAYNELNQHTTNTWWGSVTVLGVANITSGTVAVNGQPGVLRADKTFVATNLPVVEGTNEYVAVLTDVFGRAATNRVTVVARDRAFGYDANGNLTNDGEFVYVWDEADRLVEVHKGDEVVMMCRYDGLSRRRERVMKGETNRYVYDGPDVGGAGWLVVEVRDGANTVLETYTHGPDLSGSLGGAGGIGGILAVTHTGATNATYFFHYDGNGNVVRLTDTNGAVVSTLDYAPFGSVLFSTGPYTPRHQFSTKEYDQVSRLHNFGYRMYSPSLVRWLSGDPASDAAFANRMDGLESGVGIVFRELERYTFCANSPLTSVDPLGLSYESCVAVCNEAFRGCIKAVEKWHEEACKKMREECRLGPIPFWECEQSYYEKVIRPQLQAKQRACDDARSRCISDCKEKSCSGE